MCLSILHVLNIAIRHTHLAPKHQRTPIRPKVRLHRESAGRGVAGTDTGASVAVGVELARHERRRREAGPLDSAEARVASAAVEGVLEVHPWGGSRGRTWGAEAAAMLLARSRESSCAMRSVGGCTNGGCRAARDGPIDLDGGAVELDGGAVDLDTCAVELDGSTVDVNSSAVWAVTINPDGSPIEGVVDPNGRVVHRDGCAVHHDGCSIGSR